MIDQGEGAGGREGQGGASRPGLGSAETRKSSLEFDEAAGAGGASRLSGEPTVWWGGLEIPPSGSCRLEIGPLELVVERREREWRVRHREDSAAREDRLAREVPAMDADGVKWDRVLRIGAETSQTIELGAATADRPVVSLPADPFLIPPHGSVVLFVSTPLWLTMSLGGERVFELPIQRPADCWVGPTIGPGQAAYANRTQCRQALDELPVRPHRVVTPVAVGNRAAAPLRLERLVLAVPYLSLFATPEGRMWTEAIEVAIDDGEVESEICFGAPEQAGTAEPIAPPRSEPPSGGLGRMLASVF